MSLQVFLWSDFSHQDHEQQRIYYKGFTLQETKYQVGDAVYLFPECDGVPLYLGRIQSAFADCAPGASDAHCVEVRWFERLANLEANSKCHKNDRELVELEDADVNPIGCLAGKAMVVQAKCHDEAEALVKRNGVNGDWFFTRGTLKQFSSELVMHNGYGETRADPVGKTTPKRSSVEGSGPEDMADSDDVYATSAGRGLSKRQKVAAACVLLETVTDKEEEQSMGHNAGGTANKRFGKGPGKQCVECGATQTPQWREGPAGPKTLCNACGVRYNRLRSSKRNGNFGPRQSNARSKPFKHAANKDGATPRASAVPATPHLSPLLHQMYQQQEQQQQLGPNGRPLRQAALLAANRTAAFARTGEFPSEDEDALLCPGPGPDGAKATLSSGNSGNGYSSHNSSESAEEELFLQSNPQAALMSAGSSLELQLLDNFSSPEAQPAPQPEAPRSLSLNIAGMAAATQPSAPTARTVDAATCLVAMASELQPSDVRGQGAAATADGLANADSAAAVAAGNALRSAALRAVSYCPDVADFGEVFAGFERVRDRLPSDVVGQLLQVTEQLDSATSEAAAADAALQAVMQVAAARQKAADTARERASNAVDKLKGWMCELAKQYSEPSAAQAAKLYGCCAELDQPPCGGGAGAMQYRVSEQYMRQYDDDEAMDLVLNGVGPAVSKDLLPWAHLDPEGSCLLESMALLEADPLGEAADCGADLLGLDCDFDTPLMTVQG